MLPPIFEFVRIKLLKRYFIGPLRRAMFSDVTPLINLGRSRPLENEDIPALPASYDPRLGFRIFADLTPPILDADGKIPLRRTVKFLADITWRVRWLALQMALLSLAIIACELAGPVLIHKLLSLVSQPERTIEFFVRGSGVAIALGLVGALVGMFSQHYIYKLLNAGQLINAGLNKAIYETSLRLSRLARQKSPTGDVVNLMGADSDAVQDIAFGVNEFFMVLLTIFGAALLMIHFLGNAGFVAVIVLVLLVPPTKWIAKKFCLHSDAVVEQRDQRVTYMTQVLTSIRVVKSFAWEPLVTKRIAHIRGLELHHRNQFINAAGLSVVLYRSIGTIIGGVVLGTMVYLGESLTAAKLFTAMALIGVMEGPFGQLTDLISIITSAKVSAERIGKFLSANKTKPDHLGLTKNDNPVGVEFRHASFRFEGTESNVLEDITLSIPAGGSVAIVGPVGSGKSSLLNAILGEVACESGLMRFDYKGRDKAGQPRIALVSQEAFIMNATLRNNLLFGADLKSPDAQADAFIQQSLRAACLESDVARFSGGLDTEIGEHGVNLSGGQKQRVALARAVIQNPELVLLDDPLSALDHKTEDQIMERLIFGEWEVATRVVVTHRLKHLGSFDQVVFLENGRIAAKGIFPELLEKCERFAEFYREYTASADDSEIPTVEEKNNIIEVGISASKVNTSADDPLLRITENEDRQYGAVHRPHYSLYLRSMWSSSDRESISASTKLMITIFALAMIASTSMPILLNSWLGAWGNILESQQASIWISANQNINISIYVGLAAFGGFVAWAQYVLYGKGGVRAGKNLHNAMLKSVLGARIRFFDATPIGRVLNRFSKDLDTVERNLPWSFEQTIRCSFQVFGSLVLITVILPWTLVVTLPVMVLFYRLQHDYRMSSREAQRLYSVSRSPRFSHFKETLMGLPVIRAFDREQYFRDEFLRHTERNMQMFHGMVILNRWFSLRVGLTAAAIGVAVSLGALWSTGYGVMLAGTAGLVITYGMRFWDTLNWAVRSFSQLESQMTSVERLARFAEIPQEETLKKAPPKVTDKSKRGISVVFDHVKMRYAEHLPLILRGVSFIVCPGERVGIVGKTGAGKSSIFHTLFRFSEIESGDIRLGEKSTRDMHLTELRSLISIVPQDPTLFIGTFRSNCDPFDQFTDAEIWHALTRVQMEGRVRELSGGLNAIVAENGLNLSQGERQLICLARALLSDAPIILMDEATSGIDVETDAMIQATIRREFIGRTILIIAHRLATIADCDQIIELQDGIVSRVSTGAGGFHPIESIEIQKSRDWRIEDDKGLSRVNTRNHLETLS